MIPARYRASVVCPRCHIHNPSDVIQCVNCGYLFIPEDQVAQHNLLPGRPPWLSGYAVLMVLASLSTLFGITVKLLTGALEATYGGHLIPVVLSMMSVIAIVTSVALWQLRRLGQWLTVAIQLAGMVGCGIYVFNALSHMSINWNTLFINANLAVLLVIIVGATLGSLYRSFTKGHYDSSLSFLQIRNHSKSYILGGCAILTIISIGISLIIFLFDPAQWVQIATSQHINAISGVVFDGLVLSFPLTLLVMWGLYMDTARFH